MIDKARFVAQYTAFTISMFLLAALGLGQLGNALWIFDLLSHFPLQYFWIALICFMVLLFSERRLLAIVPGLAIFISLGFIIPIYFQGPQKIPTAADSVNAPEYEELGILFMNTHVANTDYTAIVNEINRLQPDVVCLAEATESTLKEISTGVEQLTTVEHIEGGGVFDLSVLSSIPSHDLIPSTFGQKDIPAVLATYEVDESKINVICAHPLPPTSMQNTADRNTHLSGIASWVQSQDNPTVVIGDFNLTPWSPQFARFIEDSGLRDARQRYGYHGTWPTQLPSALRIPIDHTFVSEGISVVQREVGESIGGDHLPVYIRLRIGE